MKRLLARLGTLSLWLLCTTALHAKYAHGKPIDFAHDVVPILNRHCVACHGGKEAKGGFSMNTRELVLEAEVVDLKQPEHSRLLQLILSSDPESQMPPKEVERLSPADVSVLQQWVEAGLPWESGYSFAGRAYEPPLAPRRPALPPVVDGRDNPVDRILDAYLVEQHQTRPTPIDDQQFLRRVYLDVVGILPPPERVTAFVAEPASDKRSKLIDELLNNREGYATHWLTFWNDLLRNAYSGTGFIDGGRKQMTQWLYHALYTNLSYDEFVRQIVVASNNSEGFIKGIKWRGTVNASQMQEIQFAQNVSQVFLGINMKCASCHDSFIDRWTLKETYGLAAAYSQQPLEIHRCDKAQGTQAVAAWIFPELGRIDPEAPQPARMKQIASLMTHPQNGRLTRTLVNRLWHRLFGRGIVHPVDAMHTEPWSVDLLDYLAVYLADQSYDIKQVLRLILNSAAYQSHAIASTSDPETGTFVFGGPIARRLTAEQFVDAVRSITGVWPQPDLGMFQRDGRDQHGQLRDVLLAISETPEQLTSVSAEDLLVQWGTRPIRAALAGLDPLQAQLGRPMREQVVTSRPTQLTTLQAINLSNGEELAELLRQGAGRLAAQFSTSIPTATPPTTQDGISAPPKTPSGIVDHICLGLLTRLPTEDERSSFSISVDESAAVTEIEDLLWTLLMLPEFQIIR
ncbi:MAG: DUF1549 domain-containing protein [Planctomycetota bacterium]|nr:DUF1549 domain-containing protein [Planctomycetota bacterium]MDA1177299.1 DUF1549 domain-containing protein [Planctomycetota bacterium]